MWTLIDPQGTVPNLKRLPKGTSTARHEIGAFSSIHGPSDEPYFVSDFVDPQNPDQDGKTTHPTGKMVAGIMKKGLPPYLQKCREECARKGMRQFKVVKMISDNYKPNKIPLVKTARKVLGVTRAKHYPPYSGDMNPQENVWKLVRAALCDYTFSTHAELRAAIEMAYQMVVEEKSDMISAFCAKWYERLDAVIARGGRFTRF